MYNKIHFSNHIDFCTLALSITTLILPAHQMRWFLKRAHIEIDIGLDVKPLCDIKMYTNCEIHNSQNRQSW